MPDFMTAIASQSDRFIEAIGGCDPAEPVPTCPGWTADDLLWHLTEVHAFWAAILRRRAQTDEEQQAVEAAKPARPADRASTVELFRTQTATLLDELRQREDDEPAWFWLDTAKTVGSTRRMQAHEATMHRVDAELTAGLPPAPIDPELAADGIAHAVEVMWAWWSTLPGFEFVPVGPAIDLQATDLPRRWIVHAGRWRGVGQSGTSYDEPGAVLAATDADTGASVTGTAVELYRWLWGRGPDPVCVGSEQGLAALRAARAAGMN